MIYLRNISTPQVIFIPKQREKNGALAFSIKNSIELISLSVDVLLGFRSSTYFKISIMLPDGITDGEYEYTFCDEVGIISTGLLVVSAGLLVLGDSSNPTEYNKTIQYEQY